MKECFRCKETKPYEAFSKNNQASDGLQSWCKDCQKTYNDNRKTEEALSDLARETKIANLYRLMLNPEHKYYKSAGFINLKTQKDLVEIVSDINDIAKNALGC